MILLVPSFVGAGGDFALRRVLSSPNASIVAVFPPNNFYFDPPDSYYLGKELKRPFGGTVNLLMLCSRTSLLEDPVNWQLWKWRCREWAGSNGYTVDFPSHPLDRAVKPKCPPRALRETEETRNPYLSITPWVERGRNRKLHPMIPPRVDPQTRSLLERFRDSHWLQITLGMVTAGWESAVLFAFYEVWEQRNRLLFNRHKVLEKMKLDKCPSPFHGLHMLSTTGVKPCGCPEDLDSPPSQIPRAPPRRSERFREQKGLK